jgi:hypothetical protein
MKVAMFLVAAKELQTSLISVTVSEARYEPGISRIQSHSSMHFISVMDSYWCAMKWTIQI